MVEDTVADLRATEKLATDERERRIAAEAEVERCKNWAYSLNEERLEAEAERDEAQEALQSLAQDHYFARAEAAEAEVARLREALMLYADDIPRKHNPSVARAALATTKEGT